MHNCEIVINQPYVETTDTYARLCAEVSSDKWNKVLYFEVDREYKDYLCAECADAFVSALLVTAMEHGYTIKAAAPVSERLYYQLVTYYIPILSRYNNYLNAISIDADLSSEPLPVARGVAVGASGGVDSFYSIIRHLDIGVPRNKLTHLLFNNVCTLDNDEERIRTWFNERGVLLDGVARELGLPLIKLYTNIYEFYEYPYETYTFFATPIYASCVFALQKLIGIYYHSAGWTLEAFDVHTKNDSAYYDIFHLQSLSTESITFYSSGVEKNRLEKVEYIADNKVVQHYLSVCAVEVSGEGHLLKEKLNCGKCKKCLRTMSELYALDKLDLFNDVFDTTAFKRNVQKNLAKMEGLNMYSASFSEEVVSLLKKKNKLNMRFYLWKFVYTPVYRLMKILRHSTVVRKLYYALSMDVKLHGYRDRGPYESFNKRNNKRAT